MRKLTGGAFSITSRVRRPRSNSVLHPFSSEPPHFFYRLAPADGDNWPRLWHRVLREEAGEIHLIVSDSGRGFDVEAAKQGKGLGLTSMRERVRLVNGTISIESKPMGGTTIHVRVPFGLEQASQRAAG